MYMYKYRYMCMCMYMYMYMYMYIQFNSIARLRPRYLSPVCGDGCGRASALLGVPAKPPAAPKGQGSQKRPPPPQLDG